MATFVRVIWSFFWHTRVFWPHPQVGVVWGKVENVKFTPIAGPLPWIYSILSFTPLEISIGIFKPIYGGFKNALLREKSSENPGIIPVIHEYNAITPRSSKNKTHGTFKIVLQCPNPKIAVQNVNGQRRIMDTNAFSNLLEKGCSFGSKWNWSFKLKSY